ncbi:MAG: iron-containing alcohol dehydrogenase [Pseudomonadota bacterium]
MRFGANCAAEQASALSDVLGPRVLVVTDAGLRRNGLPDAVLEALRQTAEVTVFDAVEADPSLATMRAAVGMASAADVTGVLGFGGGSPMDVAKATALCLGSDQPVDTMWGVDQASGPRVPLALVPTTAGTGSEVTPVAILTVGAEEKRGIVSRHLLPDVAVLDPVLTVGLPADATAATGIDAMVHAIEAYTSRSANANPISRMLAITALQKLGGAIERAVTQADDLEARSEMLLGSMLAGQAFANSPVAAVHALAYPIGGMFHIPHGLSNALVLTQVMRFNAPEATTAYAALAPHVFPDISGGGAQDMTVNFIEALEDMVRRLGLPPRLRDVGIGAEDLPKMAAEAMKQTRLLVNNPRPVRQADAQAIYEAAW